jgi:hypothetical protein
MQCEDISLVILAININIWWVIYFICDNTCWNYLSQIEYVGKSPFLVFINGIIGPSLVYY